MVKEYMPLMSDKNKMVNVATANGIGGETTVYTTKLLLFVQQSKARCEGLRRLRVENRDRDRAREN